MGAQNFSADELQEAIVYCHVRGVAGASDAQHARLRPGDGARGRGHPGGGRCSGVDAFIVQDLGMVQLCREIAPIGGRSMRRRRCRSTRSRALWRRRSSDAAGSVLARELPMRADRGTFAAEALMEIEVFVHGALCMCYSGQCYLSGVIGRRSGNRGQCAPAVPPALRLWPVRRRIAVSAEPEGQLSD